MIISPDNISDFYNNKLTLLNGNNLYERYFIKEETFVDGILVNKDNTVKLQREARFKRDKIKYDKSILLDSRPILIYVVRSYESDVSYFPSIYDDKFKVTLILGDEITMLPFGIIIIKKRIIEDNMEFMFKYTLFPNIFGFDKKELKIKKGK